MRDAFICEGVRTPVGRYGGGLSSVRADDLGAVPLRALLARYPQLDLERIDDVIFGCANQAGEDNRNVARMSALLAGLPYPEQAGSASEQIDCAYAERLAAGAAAHAEQTVLLTGVSFEPEKTGVFLWRDGKSRYYAHEKSPCGGYGTGDVFASAFTGTLLNGRTAERAARLAADYTARCAARTAQDPAHWYGLEFEPELPWLIRRLEDRE